MAVLLLAIEGGDILGQLGETRLVARMWVFC